MKTIKILIILLFIPLTCLAQEPETLTEQEKFTQWATEFWQKTERKNGAITLNSAGVTLNVNSSFYYLSPEDTERVLVDVWGNPPGQKTLGMLMPANRTPFEQSSWGVTIQYEEDGYVSDDDADDIDYAELLEQMKEDTAQASIDRVKNGYEAMKLIGWAAAPYYDKDNHKLHWAKEFKIGNYEQNTLNYNIRVLGRKGVLVLNFIAGMQQIDEINAELDNVLTLANFDNGAKYGDFNPDVDEVAAYGIGALIAGKVIAKTGLIAAAIIFLKKFGVIILIGLGVLLKKLFRRKSTE